MSIASQASLGSLRTQAQYRSDLENNTAVSTPEWNTYITQSYKELYDLLVGAYGNDYYVATTYQFTTGNQQLYPLPDGTANFTDTSGSTCAKVYKVLGVDLQYSAAPSGYVTLKRFEFIERNKFAYPNVAVNWNGWSNLRYRIEGDNLMLIPNPQTGQNVVLWFIPAPTNLQYMLSCRTTSGSLTLNVNANDTTGLFAGMQVSGAGIQSGTSISSIVGSTRVILDTAMTATSTMANVALWSDATRMEGIAGWEEYVILSSAIKAQIKQENDIQPLVFQLGETVKRIESMAEGRDVGQATHVSDVLGGTNFGSGGWGMGGGWDGSGW